MSSQNNNAANTPAVTPPKSNGAVWIGVAMVGLLVLILVVDYFKSKG